MKTRQEYLEICNICVKRSFDIKKGVTCSLTGEYATYNESECPDFDLDQPALDNKENRERYRKDNQEGALPNFFSDFGIKSEILLGLLIAIIGFSWLFYGISNDWIFAYPIAMIIIGIVLIIVGLIGKKRKS
ncbi:MAG: hypothetical protein GQ574_02265 [Crocinitomix sp.]|nr:hypothetical protein [Crocinitomix sp.]